MRLDFPFRVALAMVIALTTGVTVYHRIRAASADDKVSKSEEGLVFSSLLRFAGVALWLATLSYLVSPESVRWALFPLPVGIRWIGALAGGVCSLLMWWTLSTLGRNLTDTVVTRNHATLVTHGPYRWVRHPYYVTAALLMSSVTVLTANWLIGVTSLVVLVLLAIRTPKEEEMLVRRFGQQYLDYMARTGRFMPRMNLERRNS